VLTWLAKWDSNLIVPLDKVILNTPLEWSCNRLHFDIKTLNNYKAWKSYDLICKNKTKI